MLLLTRNHLIIFLSSVDILARHYLCAGFLIVGDFNTVDTNISNKYLCFKQMVTSPTRGKNTLDNIFTNCNIYYSVPIVLPPIGETDHYAIFLTGIDHVKSQVGYQVVTCQQLDFNTVNRTVEDLANFAWQKLYYLNDSRKQVDLFYALSFDIINKYAPMYHIKFKNNDKPWITVYFKQLISRRDDAFTAGSSVLYQKLYNQVNHVKRRLKSQYYLEQVQHLKSDASPPIIGGDASNNFQVLLTFTTR
jgi:hypothetical protein